MKKSYATPFAIAGVIMTAALLAVTNLITTPETLWCIYPIYAVAWWPIGVALCRAKHYFAFAAAGSLLTMAFLAAVNMLASPGHLRFLYTVPPLLFFPAGVYFKDKMQSLAVALSFSVIIIAYYAVINIMLTPGHVWAIYPIYLTLWWPVSLYFTSKGQYKAFSVAGAVMTIAFFIASNLLETAFPWALFACFPVLWWPVAMYFGKKMGGLKFSIFCSICTLLWYGALNIFIAPGSPWVMFVAFALAWWVLSVFFYGRQRPHVYAAVMSVISIAFFIAVNAIYSPGAIWAFYPAFAILWWPVTLLFAKYHAWRGYAFTASAMTIGFLAAVNVITSPSYPWSVFPALGILWWPLATCFKGRHKPFGFSIAAVILIAATLAAVNLITSPGILWCVFTVPALLWWPLAAGFAGKHKPFGFAILGALLAIGTLVAINLITSPSFLWSVFAALGILWWPAAVLFAKKKSPLGLSIAGSMLAMALLAAINFMTSPGFPWCVFPLFGILWWPLSVYFHVTRKRRFAEQKA